jgi:hypothetical protein
MKKIKKGRKDTEARERQKDNERKRQEAVINVAALMFVL